MQSVTKRITVLRHPYKALGSSDIVTQLKRRGCAEGPKDHGQAQTHFLETELSIGYLNGLLDLYVFITA